MDAEIVDFLQEHADRNRWRLAVYLAEGRRPSYATVGDVRGTMRARPVVPLDWLQRLGLIKNKHIPAIYKTGGRQQRLRLLAGLLDSDGCKGSGSSVYFSNTNERLVQDVVFLARSPLPLCVRHEKAEHLQREEFPGAKRLPGGRFLRRAIPSRTESAQETASGGQPPDLQVRRGSPPEKAPSSGSRWMAIICTCSTPLS